MPTLHVGAGGTTGDQEPELSTNRDDPQRTPAAGEDPQRTPAAAEDPQRTRAAGEDPERALAEQLERARADERERLAELLHETLAQDLTFISMTARRPSGADSPEPLAAIADAADRMAAALRTILLELKHPAEEPLRDIIGRVAGPVTKRTGTRLLVDISARITAPLEQKVVLGRVVREAVANAVRHGQASSIAVRAERDERGLRLQITDDGSGFAPGNGRRVDAFGIDAMRSAVEGLGGSFHVSSAPGQGTSVEVIVP